MLAFTFDPPIQKLMRTRGLPGVLLQGSRLSFELEDAVVGFKPKLGDNIKTKLVNTNNQLKVIDNLLNTQKPVRGHPIVCINSYPTDLRASCVAANIMEAAIFRNLEAQKRRKSLGQPLWIRLYSDKWYGYLDTVREESPSMLIISNVTSASTQNRLEKLRDILDCFDSIPRIVVTGTTAEENPIEFFANRLHYSLNHAVQIGPANKINSLLDL